MHTKIHTQARKLLNSPSKGGKLHTQTHASILYGRLGQFFSSSSSSSSSFEHWSRIQKRRGGYLYYILCMYESSLILYIFFETHTHTNNINNNNQSKKRMRKKSCFDSHRIFWVFVIEFIWQQCPYKHPTKIVKKNGRSFSKRRRQRPTKKKIQFFHTRRTGDFQYPPHHFLLR